MHVAIFARPTSMNLKILSKYNSLFSILSNHEGFVPILLVFPMIFALAACGITSPFSKSMHVLPLLFTFAGDKKITSIKHLNTTEAHYISERVSHDWLTFKEIEASSTVLNKSECFLLQKSVVAFISQRFKPRNWLMILHCWKHIPWGSKMKNAQKNFWSPNWNRCCHKKFKIILCWSTMQTLLILTTCLCIWCCIDMGQQDRGIRRCFFNSHMQHLGPHIGRQMPHW